MSLGIGETAGTLKNLMCSELKGPAVFALFNPKRLARGGVMYPEMYFLAAGELLCTMIGLSVVITYIAQPISMQCYNGGTLIPGCTKTTLEDNAIRRRVGHNNPCVYFDMPPAKYFAAFIFVFAAYCGIRYCILDAERTFLVRERLSGCKIFFSLFADFVYALAWAGFVMTYVIPPWENIWAHSTGFICLGLAQFFIFFSNALEGINVPVIVYIFCVIYGLLTIVEFGLVAAANFAYYDQTGGANGPLINSTFGAIVDYGWFACLAFTSAIMPKAEGMKEAIEIVAPGTKVGREVSSEDDEEDGLVEGEEEDGETSE